MEHSAIEINCMKVYLVSYVVKTQFSYFKMGSRAAPQLCCPVQPHVVPGEGQHLPPVGLSDPLLDSLLDTGPELSLQRTSRATRKLSRFESETRTETFP